MKKYILALLLLNFSSYSLACNPKTKLDEAFCVAGLGIVMTSTISLVDYGASKAAAYESVIPSDKKAEFIVGLPVVFATATYLYSQISDSTKSRRYSYIVTPYLGEKKEFGFAYYKGF